MYKHTIIALGVAFGLAASAAAQTPPPPPPPPRAPGPPLALAVEAAQVAIETCRTNGYKTTALVVDQAGVPVALLTSDGAPARTQDIAMRKVSTTLRYGVPSGEIADKIKTDPKLADETKSDPKIGGMVYRGALPLLRGGATIGAIAVSGAPGGEKDEVCAAEAIRKIEGRLK
jgi:uncharacterized protein GlcG (DUF336 family)